MKALGFNKKTLSIFTSYLSNRKQYVVVDSFKSDKLLVGPRSVTQGSTLSCALYLIFILDITQIYHGTKHNPTEYSQCSNQYLPRYPNCTQTNAKTYVDDNFLLTKPRSNQSIQAAVQETISRIQNYTNANLLALNPSKSRVMLISKDNQLKKEFSVNISGKELKHQKQLLVLGNLFLDELTWDKHVSSLIIPSLNNRARNLRQSTSCMDPQFRKIYSTAVFMGKLQFAIDSWSGVSAGLLTKIQDIQHRVAKSAMGFKGQKLSNSQRLRALGWLNIKQESTLATLRLVHKIINKSIPEELSVKMPINRTNPRLIEARKLQCKPKELNKNKRTLLSFRNRAYILNTIPHRITALQDSKRFNKWVKTFLINPSLVPATIPPATITTTTPRIQATSLIAAAPNDSGSHCLVASSRLRVARPAVPPETQTLEYRPTESCTAVRARARLAPCRCPSTVTSSGSPPK